MAVPHSQKEGNSFKSLSWQEIEEWYRVSGYGTLPQGTKTGKARADPTATPLPCSEEMQGGARVRRPDPSSGLNCLASLLFQDVPEKGIWICLPSSLQPEQFLLL